jgi:hypothetical protein
VTQVTINISVAMLKSFRSKLAQRRNPKNVEYIVIDQVTYEPGYKENIEQIKSLLLDGYKIVSAVGNDAEIHYTLVR